MASYTISPIWGAGAQLFDNNGDPLSGGKIYTYLAGSTTPAVTYTSPTGSILNTNPIVANAAGRLPNEVWLPIAQAYKFVLKDANDTLIATYDNIPTLPQPPIVNDAASISFTSTNTIPAGAFTPGYIYEIAFVGSTDFMSIGAAANTVGTLFTATGAGTGTGTAYYVRSVQNKLNDTVSVKDFGAIGDGVADDTVAIAAAHATGKLVFYPYGIYKHVGYFPLCEGGIIGEGWSTNNGAKKTEIVFYNCTSTSAGAITPTQTTPKSQFFVIKNIMIRASSWDSSTGCLGYGLDIGAPVIMEDVYVGSFKKSNLFFHQVWPVGGDYVTAPYESRLSNVYSAYSGQHGCLVGYGANVLTFINYEGKWNGAPSYNVKPTSPGSYDGFKVSNTADGNDITAYNPQNISVISGDCSYNSGYGWNFDNVRDTNCAFPGYAEGNLTNQARIGDISNCLIAFGAVENNVLGITNNQSYVAYFYGNTIYYNGKQIHPVNYYGFVANPQAEDVTSGGATQNAPSRLIYLSRSNDGSNTAYVAQNSTPDGTAVDKTTETVATIRGFGTYYIGLGDGARHIKIGTNFVRLPDQYRQATGTGWNAASVIRGVGTAAPTSGTWAQGDIIYDTTPTAGGFIGWVCTSSGTPGTWKTFGAISA